MAGVHQPRSNSPRPDNGRLERHPSTSGYSAHAHNRQTSIVNGVQHRGGAAHSRSGSYVNSPATSPLSPLPVMQATITASEMVHIPQFQAGQFPPSPMTPMMNIASTVGPHTQIHLPQIPSSPVLGPTSAPGSHTTANSHGGIVNHTAIERPALLSQQSTPAIMQQPPRPRAHHHGHSHHHHHSHSRSDEAKTPAEYALHILFTQFVRVAERKVNSCLPPNHPLDNEPNIEVICGAGVDPAFDKLIGSLGYIARHKPKPVIDSLMIWRKSKSDAAAFSRQETSQQGRHQMLPRRNTEPVGVGEGGTVRESALVADRRTTVAIYILCRVLIEVIGQTTLDRVTEDMAKLEDIIFNQLKSADPEILSSSPLRMANWILFGQLLGVMSSIDFERVTDRFFADLEKSASGPVNKEQEARVELVVRGMSYIKLKFYPENVLEESADFMVSLARFFANAQSVNVKVAYCDIFMKLLLPVASTAKTELNHPTWQEFVNLLHPKLNEMVVKPRHWHTAFPLMGTLLCVSPPEIFAACWMPLIDSNLPKLRDKDRSMRVPIVQTLARLVWTYLFRCTETLNNTTKKLERIVAILLTKDKKEKSLVTAEQQVVEPCIQLIRFIGFKYQDLCFRTIVFPLLNVDSLSGATSVKLEQLSPEGMVVGIRAFLAIIADLEKGDAGMPPFPVTFASSPPEKIPPTSTWLAKIEAEKKDGLKVKIDRRSRAVAVDKLGETAKEYHDRFCEILGSIIVLCDMNFGGQAVLDEKFAGVIPKTPQEPRFMFGSIRDEQTPGVDQKQGFYQLLNVAIEALPRCLPPNIPFHKIVNLLCNGTAHVDVNVASSSANALKSIARQYNSQQVIIGFARFIFAFDERYSTISEGGMLGSGHIEGTLKLYIELLTIWLDTIKQKVKGTKDANNAASTDSASTFDDKGLGNRSEDLEYSSVQAYVEEIESNGLFFLCSQSRTVRRFAIMVLRIITEFDAVLNETTEAVGRPSHSRQSSGTVAPPVTRVIHILEGDSLNVMNLNDDNLPVAERSRLQRELKGSRAKDALVSMAISENQYDASLWFRIFPSLIRVCNERCPMTMVLCRDLVCGRLLQMHQAICSVAQSAVAPPMNMFEIVPRPIVRPMAQTSPEVMIEQWKLYLIVACSTLTSTDGERVPPRPRTPQHVRRPSKNQTPLAPFHLDRITSARAVFQMVIPLLSVDNQMIREAVVSGLGSININLYKTLIESLQPTVLKWGTEDARRGRQNSPRRNRRQDRLRAEITHVFQLTSHFLQKEEVYKDTWILRHMVAFIKEMKIFLNDPDVQIDWEHQKLRRFFCGLTEELYEGIRKTDRPEQWLPFDGRLSTFYLMQDWCGHGPNWNVVKDREEKMRRSLLDMQRDLSDSGNLGTLTAAVEIEKRNLKIAALSAMASLCAGPVMEDIGSNAVLSFNVDELFRWIESIFATPSDRTHRIGRRALKNILQHNQETSLLSNAIRLCYMNEASSKATQSYFTVVCEVLREVPSYLTGIWKIMTLCLYKLGDENADIRLQAAKLLRVTEERQFPVSTVQEFEVSISDKTVAVYKRAQFQVSKTLSIQYSDMAVFVFSELTMFFNLTEGKAQRDILHALLPWIQRIDLAVEPNGDLFPSSYMVLANLFEMTVKFSSKIHSEIQAVWQSLATAPFLNNVSVILNFILHQSLERKEQNFVEFGKQIVVFLSETLTGANLVGDLVMFLQPKLMTIVAREPSPIPDGSSFPYVADLKKCIPEGRKPTGFSYGHLAMILMVDLLVGPVPEMLEKLTLLLQVVFVLWDHYVPLVQEQAKEMLIHLIHELVIPSLGGEDSFAERIATLEFIETVRRHDSKTYWSYDEITSTEETGLRVPNSMEHMISVVLDMFSIANPNLKAEWGKVALNWATTCPVRHLACRSFQVFRCLLTTLDHTMLSDMLARLSNTIADDLTDIRLFAMEILITLNAIIAEMDEEYLTQYPQLFWATVACLNTVHEGEFMEVLSILEMLLDKIDLKDPSKVAYIMATHPPKWVGNFEGLQTLIDKGLRSSASYERTLKVFDKLNEIPTNELVGGESRLLFAILANIPRFSQAQDQGSPDEEVLTCAERLKVIAEAQDYKSLARVMGLYATQRFRSRKDFVSQTVNAIRDAFFPTYEAQALIFLVGLLSNKIRWVKLKTMEVLTVMVPFIDMRKPAFAGVGADLISPLLRLLQTDYVEQALEVLDKMLTISGGPMDRHVMRMSMGNRTIRKEYEKTQTLFGIPDESGWAIPMPAINAGMTRDNVHAVFYTCTQAAAAEEETPPTPDVQFHMEDYSYTSLPDRTATMLSEDGRGEGGFSDTVLRLGDLDAFFGGDDSSSLNQSSVSFSDAEFGTENGETAQVYDNRVYAILNRSLGGRTPSVTSFQASFADSLSTPTQRDQPGVMTPTAFTAPPIPPGGRGYAPRSVSSPQLHNMARPGEDYSLSETEEEQEHTESDLEFPTDIPLRAHTPDGRAHTPDGRSHTPDGTLRRGNSFRDEPRGMRRVFRAGGLTRSSSVKVGTLGRSMPRSPKGMRRGDPPQTQMPS